MSLTTSPTPRVFLNFRRKSDSLRASACSLSSSTLMSLSWSICSLRFINLNYASFEVGTADEFRLDRELLRRELERFASQFDIDPLDLVHHTARLYNRDPVIRSTFTRTHSGFSRLFGDRLIREYPDPDLTATFDVTRHRDTSRFDLAVGDPTRFQCFQSEVPEVQVLTARGFPAHATFHDSPVLDLFRHQHNLIPRSSLVLRCQLFFSSRSGRATDS